MIMKSISSPWLQYDANQFVIPRSGEAATRDLACVPCGWPRVTDRRSLADARDDRGLSLLGMTLTKQRPHPIGVLTAAPELDTTFELDHVPARLVAANRENPVDCHDDRAVDPDKPGRIELLLRLLHGAAPEVRPGPRVQAEVVVRDIHPVDLFRRHHVMRIAAPNDEAGPGASRALRLRRTGHERLPVPGRSAVQPFARTVDGR